jgi:hypothetical protein
LIWHKVEGKTFAGAIGIDEKGIIRATTANLTRLVGVDELKFCLIAARRRWHVEPA